MQSYAVVKTGGKQYTVQEGDVLNVELLTGANEGDELELTTLATGHNGEMSLGKPELDSKVKATIVGDGRAKKVIVFKNKRRSTYRKKNGHRQGFHTIRIDSIPQ